MGTGFCLLANQVGCVLVLTGTLGTCHIIMPKVIHTLAAVDRVAVCGGQSIRQVILTAKTVAAVLRLPVDRIACNADGICLLLDQRHVVAARAVSCGHGRGYLVRAGVAAVDAVIIPVRGSASVNADAVKTSAGALHTLPVCREQNLRSTLQYLKDSGFRIVAATEKGDYDYTKADYTGPLCIIMGAEDTGVSYENLALCDEWVKIPMLGTIESLNVSVAAGILIYEAVKQRNND